jgi:hypothetical protein
LPENDSKVEDYTSDVEGHDVDYSKRNQDALMTEPFHKLIRSGDIESCSLFDPAVWNGFEKGDDRIANQKP